MKTRAFPRRPSLEQYRKQAKDLVKSHRCGDSSALELIQQYHPRFSGLARADIAHAPFALTDAQFVLARQHGLESWPKFVAQVERLTLERTAYLQANPGEVFLEAACIPLHDSHTSGTLDEAESILATHPEVAGENIFAAAVLGDETGVRHWLTSDRKSATAKGGPYGWDALTYLCFSRYLRRDAGRSEGFVRAATALLDAGADANTGWIEPEDRPYPEWESVIYGAAAVAAHVGVTRLLLERGADPNDNETPYHVAESYDLAVLEVMVESGKLNEESLTTILLRKTDWHDYEGLKYLLEHGANPNSMTHWGNTALNHGLRRDNAIQNIDLMLDHGGDPALVSRSDGRSATAIAARRGRGEVFASLERRGIPVVLDGADKLIAACARNDGAAVAAIAEAEPSLVGDVLLEGGSLLAEFAGNGNTEGVRLLLDLGVKVSALYVGGDGYFEVAKSSTALHVAAWRLRHGTVKLLLERGAEVDAWDGRGQTALRLAVRACVHSHWVRLRTPESIEALLRAGASAKGIVIPTGYLEADELLRQYS